MIKRMYVFLVAGSQDERSACAWLEKAMICSDHEECAARAEMIKTRKGFVAREPVKGHMASSFLY